MPPVEKMGRDECSGLFTQGDGLCGERLCLSQFIPLAQDFCPAESSPSYPWHLRIVRWCLHLDDLPSQLLSLMQVPCPYQMNGSLGPHGKSHNRLLCLLSEQSRLIPTFDRGHGIIGSRAII